MKILLASAVLCCLVLSGTAMSAEGATESKIEALLNRDGPKLNVRIVEQPATSNWHYDIHVTTADGLDQHFAIRNGQPITVKDVRLTDITADGFLDILIVGGKDHRGQEWFKTWVYDPKAKKYKWINYR